MNDQNMEPLLIVPDAQQAKSRIQGRLRSPVKILCLATPEKMDRIIKERIATKQIAMQDARSAERFS